MALAAIFADDEVKEIEDKVIKDEDSKRRAESGHAAAEIAHESRGWRNGVRTGAEADVSGAYSDDEEPDGKRQRTADQIGVLMVCQTNLARSPAAAAVFHSKAKAVHCGHAFYTDSPSLGGGNAVRVPGRPLPLCP